MTRWHPVRRSYARSLSWWCLFITIAFGSGYGMSLEAQARPAVVPEGVTDSAIALGKGLFHGAANCVGCHGTTGQGSAAGPDLTDATWLHGDGSYEMIVRLVTHGVTQYESTRHRPMPMRGWAPIDDSQVRAVAAYVWSLGKARRGSRHSGEERPR